MHQELKIKFCTTITSKLSGLSLLTPDESISIKKREQKLCSDEFLAVKKDIYGRQIIHANKITLHNISKMCKLITKKHVLQKRPRGENYTVKSLLNF